MNAREKSRLIDEYIETLKGNVEVLGPVLGGTGYVCPRCGGIVSTEMGPAHGDYSKLIEVARKCLECGWARSLLPSSGGP